MTQFFLIFVLIIVAAFAGYILHALTLSGAFAAVMTGLFVFLGFGINGLVLLGLFFASSSFWSNYRSSAKQMMEEKLAKGSVRDWRQVAANGGAAVCFSLLNYFFDNAIWLTGFAVCIASANSDTWASEIGSLSSKKPIYIRTLKRVERGTSGAVSLLGSIAGLAGSLLISLGSLWLFDLTFMDSIIIFLFGFIGNVIDTLIGAFYQQVYLCQICGLETEKKQHCHMPAVQIKGFTYIDNDMVNFVSGLIASLLAVGVLLSGETILFLK